VKKPKPPKPKTSVQLQNEMLMEMKNYEYEILEINRRSHLKHTGEFAPYQDPFPNMEAGSITMNCFFNLPVEVLKNNIVRKVKVKGYKRICKQLAEECCGKYKEIIMVFMDHEMKRRKLNITARFTRRKLIIGPSPFKLMAIGKEFKARVSSHKKLKGAKCTFILAMVKPPKWLKDNKTFVGLPNIENPWDKRFFEMPEAEVAPPIQVEPEPEPEPQSSSDSEEVELEPEPEIIVEDFDTETEIEQRDDEEVLEKPEILENLGIDEDKKLLQEEEEEEKKLLQEEDEEEKKLLQLEETVIQEEEMIAEDNDKERLQDKDKDKDKDKDTETNEGIQEDEREKI